MIKESVEYKINDKFDFTIFVPVIVLIISGLVAIYSSTLNHPTASGNFNKQLIWSIISIVVFFAVYYLPPLTFRFSSLPIYLTSIILLFIVIFIGSRVSGAKSWISFGSVGFQPSEFAKVGLILYLAYWLTKKKRDINKIQNLLMGFAIGLLPILLIMLQPDMGTALVFGFISLAMIFWAGISLFGLFIVLSPALVIFASLFGTVAHIVSLLFVIFALVLFKRNLFISGTIFVANMAASYFFDFAVGLLQPHQQKRIFSFINPYSDPLGSGYNSLQAKVAIGSGGLFGKGFLEGNQTQLRFIPAQWTDFIFCVIGEEFGFIGSLIVITMFMILFLRMVKLASSAKDGFSSLIVVGILTLFFAHFVINIGMNTGIAPVIGIPLPFLSYGGSSLLVNMILLGITLNIYKNRVTHT
ncbi:MAG: rod shape-determining protein RodA [Ignavibacteria bacterium]|jgi:rod shape determining protein RodA